MDNIDQKREELVTKLRTLWHPLAYHLYKTVMIPRQTEVIDELDASKQPPKIDLVLRHKGE